MVLGSSTRCSAGTPGARLRVASKTTTPSFGLVGMTGPGTASSRTAVHEHGSSAEKVSLRPRPNGPSLVTRYRIGTLTTRATEAVTGADGYRLPLAVTTARTSTSVGRAPS